MLGHTLPRYPDSIKRYKPKYHLCIVGFVKKSLTNKKKEVVLMPLYLMEFVYHYGLYFFPVMDTIRSLPGIVGFRYIQSPGFHRDQDINTLMTEIHDFILPFTEQSQIKYQLPFDFLDQFTSFDIQYTFGEIINQSGNPSIIRNIIWLMVHVEQANDSKKIPYTSWIACIKHIKFSRIFSYFKSSNDIQFIVWKLLAIITDHSTMNNGNTITIMVLNSINIFQIIFEQIHKLINMAHQSYKRIHLHTIQLITKTFDNIIIYHDRIMLAGNNNTLALVSVIHHVLFRMITLEDFIDNSQQKNDKEMKKIITQIRYNAIKSLSYLINDGGHHFLYSVLNRLDILTHQIMISNYIKLLNSNHSNLRQNVQKLIISTITIREYSMEDQEVVVHPNNLIRQYIQLGLTKQINSTVTQKGLHMIDEEIDNYLIIIINILKYSHSNAFVNSLLLDPAIDGIIHWVLLLLDRFQDWDALQAIILITNYFNIDVFEKIIKFENSYIFKIFHDKLTKCINDSDDKKVNYYLADENGHIYIVLFMIVIFMDTAKRKTKDTKLTKFIYEKVNITKLNLFIDNCFPSLCKRIQDNKLDGVIKYLKTSNVI